ncbi:FxsA family membrane protein [Kitasatospora camelliae]|uniref:FxsA family membrane protein n=1 Tax=Kitasatospora camelliae TaxID=3156397 RepID=A0AAU8K5Z5_9ACTN
MTEQVDRGRPAPRGRLRRVLPLLVAAWLVLEIWLVMVVADAIGWLAVLVLLLAGLFLGGWLIRRAGSRAFSQAVEQTRNPQSQQPQTGTSMTVLAGLLLMVPGFLSDVLAVTLLLPPTRALWRGLGRRVGRAALRSTAPRGADPFADALHLQEQLRIHRPDGKVIQGEVVDQPTRPDGPDTDYRPPLAK